MSEPILKISDRARLGAEIGYLMVRGAGYAAAIVFGSWALLWVISEVGNQLPEASRETPDPTPVSMIMPYDVKHRNTLFG